MTGTSTATVETLTAEVRVLMVGSRQVTLSVARQLDVVDLPCMHPFGRVRLGTRSVVVIGRHRATGSLVLADFMGVVLGDAMVGAEDLSGIVLVPRCAPHNGHWVRLTFSGRAIEIDQAAVEFQPCRHSPGEPQCSWDPNGQGAQIGQVIAQHVADEAAYQAARTLPLIVLAGLK